ncbi:hypothetical protein Tco_0954344, partial [Tanacetum coccineum]
VYLVLERRGIDNMAMYHVTREVSGGEGLVLSMVLFELQGVKFGGLSLLVPQGYKVDCKLGPCGDIVITEYLVNISKRPAFWSLNEDILKITILITNTPYPSRKIRHIRACTHQIPQRKLDQYAVSSEDQYTVLEI